MRRLREGLLRLWGTITGRRSDADIDDELRLFEELAAEDAGRRGAQPGQAARIAAIAAGGRAQAMEAVRDQRGLPWLDDLARDVRHAFRTLTRVPAFTAVALVTLALGTGANTAIFTIVNAALLRPLAYPEPDRLMFVATANPEFSSTFPVAPPEYFELREINRTFSALGAYTTREVNLTASDRPYRVKAVFADAQLIDALGVKPQDGRAFTIGEAEVNAPWFPGSEPPPAPVAILSHELWQRAFGGVPIVGTLVEIDGRRREVIGIMPPGTHLEDQPAEIWLPLGLNPATKRFRGYHVLSVIGRLRDGLEPVAAQRELDALIPTWSERVGKPVEDHSFQLPGSIFSHMLRITPLHHAILGDASRSIWLLQAAVGLVLLIACSNLANLLLARAETRRREFAVRTALGASSNRLLRQSIVEGLLLSIAGGVMGFGLANVGVEAVLRAYPTSLPRTADVSVDVPVLLFALGVSTAAGVVFGLVPFAQTRVRELMIALKESGDRGGTGRHLVRRGLVVVQVGLAVMLVIGAALLLRTILNLSSVDGGFDRSRLVTFAIALTDSDSRQTSRVETYQRLLPSLAAIPGVQAATAMSELPPNEAFRSESTDIDNYVAPPQGPFESVDYYQSVMSGYFETMGIPILQGRGFVPGDAVSPGMVAIVNERLANTFWAGKNPIGQRIRPDWGDWVPWFTVIGVAKDVKQGGVDRVAGTEMYFYVDEMARAPSPLGRTPDTMNIVLRTTLPPASIAAAIARIVREVDPSVPIVRLRNMEEVFAESIGRRRLLAQLLTSFAVLALVLAAVGTYGVFSYMVAERRREIGIRMALGAGRSSILAQIMRQGAWLTAIGVVAGLAGAYGANRMIASMLFGIESTDAATIVIVVITIAAVAALACWVPAFRASRVDPNVVLRGE